MDSLKALSVLKKLADGIDPETGEVYPPSSPYNKAVVVRSLHCAIDELKKSSKALKKKRHPNHGKPWKDRENDRLVAFFQKGFTEGQIADELGRSKYAIHLRLVKNGLVEDDSTLAGKQQR